MFNYHHDQTYSRRTVGFGLVLILVVFLIVKRSIEEFQPVGEALMQMSPSNK